MRDPAGLHGHNATLADLDAGANSARYNDEQTQQDQNLPFFLQEESLLRPTKCSDGQSGNDCSWIHDAFSPL